MKKVGFITFTVGLFITVLIGLGYFTQALIVEPGNSALLRETNHESFWSPRIGIAVMFIGAIIFVGGFKKKEETIK